MPHSWHYPVGRVLEHIWRLAPTSVLDVGAGYGKWGFLSREMLDWNAGRLERDDWTTRIDGVDAFPYESCLHAWVYDSFRVDDVVHCEFAGYDLVVMCDVIEHIPKQSALRFLRRLLDANRNVIVATPVEFFGQEIADNPYEQHVSHWGREDFSRFTYDLDVCGGALVVLLAGQGASEPSARRCKVNRLVDSVPVLRGRGATRTLVKESAVRAFG
jgi:hypothetical protein